MCSGGNELKKVVFLLFVIAFVVSGMSAFAADDNTPEISVHGYMQNRANLGSDGARFELQRMTLITRAKFPDGKEAYVEVYHHPHVPDDIIGGNRTVEQYRTYVESAYVQLPIMENGDLRVGHGRLMNFGMVPHYGNRKTSQYGIVAETFTQDRMLGAQFMYKKDNFVGGVTLYNDYRVGTRSIGYYPGVQGTKIVRHLADRDDPANLSRKLAVAVRGGIENENWQAHVSGAWGKLNQDDYQYVGGLYGVATTNSDHNKYGVDVKYQKDSLLAQGEYYVGNWSFVQLTGWQVLVGYQPKTGAKAYLRYSNVDNNQTANANQQTWDISQWTLGVVYPISKGVWLELNYERNEEDTPAGVAKVDNDLLFVELFTGF